MAVLRNDNKTASTTKGLVIQHLAESKWSLVEAGGLRLCRCFTCSCSLLVRVLELIRTNLALREQSEEGSSTESPMARVAHRVQEYCRGWERSVRLQSRNLHENMSRHLRSLHAATPSRHQRMIVFSKQLAGKDKAAGVACFTSINAAIQSASYMQTIELTGVSCAHRGRNGSLHKKMCSTW